MGPKMHIIDELLNFLFSKLFYSESTIKFFAYLKQNSPYRTLPEHQRNHQKTK